jgi:hypothetical protein
VPDLFPGPVLASLRADPDRPAFEIGPRTVSRVVFAPAVGRFYPDRTRVIAMPAPAPPPLQVLDLTRYLRHRIAHTGQRSKD